ncbi:MAG: acyl-CoA thioesterase [Chloroflexi bacterium]|nr:acyl-CoA thioesterase [Chloroflexota bacterium]
MQRFTTTLRVRHYEMDALGHVNNAVYLHYLEQAAIEHSEQLGMTMQRYEELGGVFILRKMEIDYRLPAVAGETLEITTWVKEMRGPRSIRCYEIRRQVDNRLVVSAEAMWAWVDRKAMRPRAIPQALLDVFMPPPPLPEAPKPLLCSRCSTPLEALGLQPLRQNGRPNLFGGQQSVVVSPELVETYQCPSCGLQEIFRDSEQSDD